MKKLSGIIAMALVVSTSAFAADLNQAGSITATGSITADGDLAFNTNDKAVRGKTNSGALRTVLRLDSANAVRFGSPNPEMGDLKLQVGGQSAALVVSGGTGNVTTVANVTVGNTLSAAIVEIRGAGNDLAETFKVNSTDTVIKPGMLVSIDPKNAGQLVLSQGTYDRKVAGIISGAGDRHAGIHLGDRAKPELGEQSVALTGRAWCYVDMTAGKITPGDMLTTSTVPGHAMKVTDFAKAPGSVIGKAMTPANADGMVLVLVNLH